MSFILLSKIYIRLLMLNQINHIVYFIYHFALRVCVFECEWLVGFTLTS